MQSFAVIPAAGRSVRMGQPKLLLPWGATTLVEHVLAVWRASRVSQVVIVVHPEDRPLAELAASAGAIVVEPPTPPPQMKDSIRAALAAIERQFQPAPLDPWLLAPADLPGITAVAIDRLLAAYERLVRREGAPPIVAGAEGGRRRHPVVIPWQLAPEVEKLGADEGMDTLLTRHPVELVELGDAMRFDDLDTPADYERRRPPHAGR